MVKFREIAKAKKAIKTFVDVFFSAEMQLTGKELRQRFS